MFLLAQQSDNLCVFFKSYDTEFTRVKFFHKMKNNIQQTWKTYMTERTLNLLTDQQEFDKVVNL